MLSGGGSLRALARGEANWGDEDLFVCPFCRHVYLLEYEIDTVRLDVSDLKKRVLAFNTSDDLDSLLGPLFWSNGNE
jgi:hypothetical protein